MVQEATSDISTDIKNYIEENGVDTGKAKRVNYLEMVFSLGKGYAYTEFEKGVDSLKEAHRVVYVSGLRKIMGSEDQIDVGEEPQSGCLYLLKDC